MAKKQKQMYSGKSEVAIQPSIFPDSFSRFKTYLFGFTAAAIAAAALFGQTQSKSPDISGITESGYVSVQKPGSNNAVAAHKPESTKRNLKVNLSDWYSLSPSELKKEMFQGQAWLEKAVMNKVSDFVNAEDLNRQYREKGERRYQPTLKDLETVFSRLTTYKDYVMDVHKSTGWSLPVLYGMTFRESQAKHDAHSPGDDAGLWQISRPTGKSLDLIIGNKDYRFDPKKSSEKIKVLLNELNAIYGNKHHLKIAAYNQGPNRTSNNIREGRPMTAHVRDHVLTIMAAAYINARHKYYGITIQQMPQYSDKLKNAYPVKINETKTLGELARKYGKPENEIAYLNPGIFNPSNKGSMIAAGQYIKVPK